MNPENERIEVSWWHGLPEAEKEKLISAAQGREAELSQSEKADALRYIDDLLGVFEKKLERTMSESDRGQLKDEIATLLNARSALEQKALLEHLKEKDMN